MSTTIGEPVTAPTPAHRPKAPRRNWPVQGFALVVVVVALITGIALSAGGPTPKHQLVGGLELSGAAFKSKDLNDSCTGGGKLKALKSGATASLYGVDSKPLGTARLTPGVITQAKTCLFAFNFGEIADTAEYTVQIPGVPFQYLTKAELKDASYQFKLATVDKTPAATAKKK